MGFPFLPTAAVGLVVSACGRRGCHYFIYRFFYVDAWLQIRRLHHPSAAGPSAFAGTLFLESLAASNIIAMGCVRSLLYEYANSERKVDLTPEQQKEISLWIESAKHGISDREHIAPSNIIIILVESLMSVVSDFTIDGKEVTPFLNTLKRDSTVYYNGKYEQKTTIGESLTVSSFT